MLPFSSNRGIDLSNLQMDSDGNISVVTRPSYIAVGAWLILTNSDIKSLENQGAHFALGSRKPTDPRRVVLLERPGNLPRMIKVRARSASEISKSHGYPHHWHSHDSEFPKCCCREDPSKPHCTITKSRYVVNFELCVPRNFCCSEPQGSSIWVYLT